MSHQRAQLGAEEQAAVGHAPVIERLLAQAVAGQDQPAL